MELNFKMTTWQSLPEGLQFSDKELRELSLQTVEKLFKIAEDSGLLNEFSELFWPAMQRACSNPDTASIQKCVELMEERKRTLGRCYDYSRNSAVAKRYFAIRYNECEYNIQWLAKQYNCTRKTKEYFLEV